MQVPAVQDTIVAVSSGWQAAPLGIVRLSGPDSFALLHALGVTPPAGHVVAPCWSAARLRLDAATTLAANVFWFPAPRSYTGQDVVELHTIGCLPLLRALSEHLIELGARQAQPGEFTARAFLLGKLDATQVDRVLSLMQARDQATRRAQARGGRDGRRHAGERAVERITALLAAVEAGIDFVEEDDVRFVSPAEVVRTLDAVIADLNAACSSGADALPSAYPHVVLAGLPNAGKSTLFNRLIASERALVSSVPGTTRDVLSATLTLDSATIVLQDCAAAGPAGDAEGTGAAGPAEPEAVARAAAANAVRQADLVLWLHAADTAWEPRELEFCGQIPRARRVLVRSKIDLGERTALDDVLLPFSDALPVSALRGDGLVQLRDLLARRVGKLIPPVPGDVSQSDWPAAIAALRRARDLARPRAAGLASPELVALELRAARELLAGDTTPVDEEILARIFSEFCIGK